MDGHSHPTPPGRCLDELEAEITELAGHLNAAQHRWGISIDRLMTDVSTNAHSD